jgi:hypothetical protein
LTFGKIIQNFLENLELQQKLHLLRITLQDAASSPMLHVISDVNDKKRLLEKSWPAIYFMGWMALGSLQHRSNNDQIPVIFFKAFGTLLQKFKNIPPPQPRISNKLLYP